MFEKTKLFFRRLFIPKAVSPISGDSESRRARRLAAGELPELHSTGCVFEGAFLREITGRKEPARPLGETETFWSVPSGDLPVEVTIKRGDNLPPLETTLAVRFEPEMGLGTLLEGREELTGGEWGDLVRSRFAGLLDLLAAQKNDLIGLSDDSLEQLRVKFSLLLSDGGLRCVGIEPFIERPEPVSSEANPEETALGDAAESEMSERIETVWTESEWDEFLQNLQDDGFTENAAVHRELDDLGADWIARRMTSSEAAAVIRQIAEASADDNLVQRPDLSYWNGLALRLRLDGGAESEEESKTIPPNESAVPVTVPKSRRPKRGFFSGKVKVDQKLRSYLAEKIDSAKRSLESRRASSGDIREQVRLRGLVQELDLIKDRIATLPELEIRTADLRLDRFKFADFVREMNLAVTAAEFIDAATAEKNFLNQAGAMEEIRTALDSLNAGLKNRRQVRS